MTAITLDLSDEVRIALGKALAEVSKRLLASPVTTTPVADTVVSITRDKSKAPDRVTRLRMQEMVLGEVERRGQMTYTAFRVFATTKASYGRGWVQFFRGLCKHEEGMVTLTAKGKKRLAWIRETLGEIDG